MKKIGLAFLLLLISLPVSAQNVILVSPMGGDFADPVAALDAIGSTLPAATRNNRYLVKLNPGVYNVTSPVVMKPFVDLEGSGIQTTLIRGAIGSTFGTLGNLQGIINAASRSEIRNLAVRNNWSDTSAVGIAVNDNSNSMITNVKSVSGGNAIDTAAWKYGVFIENSRGVRLTHVIARGTAGEDTACQGVAVRSSRVSISDSRMIGAGGNCTIGLGLNASMDSIVQVNSSVLRGDGSINGISVSGTSSNAGEETTIRIRHSLLNGSVFEGTPGEGGISTILISHSELTGAISGTPTCFSSHDSNLVGLSGTCVP